MKKVLCFLLLMVSIIGLVGCNSSSKEEKEPVKPTVEIEDMILKIDDQIIDITWENNDSVNELMAYAKDGLSIEMQRYGGFEQVGPIGKTIKSNNSQMTTTPGDVVLYSGNQIVVFFGTNTWSYTKLGHINLTQNELNDLLNKSSVTLRLEEKIDE
ncbi:MAG: hypothetical protein E7338_04775 [Clostridiales bacterium]|nr:hypothetical protein [Clostridiales bacterium]